MRRLPSGPPGNTRPDIRLVAIAQLAWVLFLALPTVATLGWSLWPRPGAVVKLRGLHFTGGPLVLAAGIEIALAPSLWYLAVLAVRRNR